MYSLRGIGTFQTLRSPETAVFLLYLHQFPAIPKYLGFPMLVQLRRGSSENVSGSQVK